MFEKLDVFRMSHAMATHAGVRQAVVAQNMANADTPGYAARDIAPFQTVYESQGGSAMPRATRDGHMLGSGVHAGLAPSERDGAVQDPNGNSVALETEMLNAVEVKRQHDRAIAIYRSSLTLLRTALGRG
jgi:flagellar basal-body rod protein FlgB